MKKERREKPLTPVTGELPPAAEAPLSLPADASLPDAPAEDAESSSAEVRATEAAEATESESCAAQSVEREQLPSSDIPSLIKAAARRAGLGENATSAVRAILEPVLEHRRVSDTVVSLIARALSHEEDLKAAHAEGYRAGRNEKIDAINRIGREHPEPQPVNFPKYRRRSFWER